MGLLGRVFRRTDERRLRDLLRGECRGHGVELPRRVEVVIDGQRARLSGSITPSSAPAWLDGRPHPLLVEHAVSTARHMALAAARRRLADRLSGDADMMVMPWTRLVHPLALRMVLEDLGDRSRGPYEWMSGSSGRIRDFHYQHRDSGTIEFTRIMTSRRDDPAKVEHVFTFLPREDGVQRAQFAITAVIPGSTAAALAGEPLSRLVTFPETGDDEVDRAVGRLVIEEAAPTEASTVVTLAPTRWITYASPPPAYAAWDGDAGYMA